MNMTTSIEIQIDGDWIEMEFEVEFTASRFIPAKTYGRPENCYPAEGGEVEILSVFCSTTKVTFDDDDFVFMKNWALVVDGRKPTYTASDLEDECRENIDDDDGFDPPDSGYDDYRDNPADDYIN